MAGNSREGFLVQGDYTGDDSRDGQNRNGRKDIKQRFEAFAEQAAQDETVQQGKDHDPEHGPDHAPKVHVHPLSGQEFHQGRSGQGASRVEIRVMTTDRGTSALAK